MAHDGMLSIASRGTEKYHNKSREDKTYSYYPHPLSHPTVTCPLSTTYNYARPNTTRSILLCSRDKVSVEVFEFGGVLRLMTYALLSRAHQGELGLGYVIHLRTPVMH